MQNGYSFRHEERKRMHRIINRVVVCIALATLPQLAFAQYADRASTPDRYRFDLMALYPNDEAWRAAKEKLEARITAIRQFKGTLGSSPQQLLTAIDTITAINKEYTKLYVYASLISDVDTRVAKYQAMQQEM